jgi:hypothetical protein
LNAGDSYQWTVRAFNSANVASAWSSALTFSIAVPLPGVPTPLAPTGTIASTTPTFSWNVAAGAAYYDVSVGNTTTGQTQVIRNQHVSGTSFTSASALIAGDAYQWTVRAFNSANVAGAWSTALAFTIAVPPPAAPTPVAPTGVIQSATPTFSWNAVTGAVYYDVSVDDTTTGQTQVVRNQHVSGATFTPASPLTAGDSYQWTVRAFNSASVAGAWSAAVAFTIAGPAPAVPTPLAPTGAIQSTTPTFSWNAAANAAYYDIVVSDTTTGQNQALRNQHVSGTSFTPTTALTPGHGYSWWVRAFNSANVAGGWSATMSFTIAVPPAPPAPTPIGPVGTLQNPMPTFSWNAVPGAASYAVSLYDTTANTWPVGGSNITGTTWTPTTPLTLGDSFAWWVRSYPAQGSPSPWSAMLKFTVALLATPVPLGPTAGALVTTPTFTWNAVAGADYYQLSVYDVTTGTNQIGSLNHITGTSVTPTTPFPRGHVYEWWVRAWSNSGDLSTWSVGSFFNV